MYSQANFVLCTMTNIYFCLSLRFGFYVIADLLIKVIFCILLNCIMIPQAIAHRPANVQM